MEKDKKKLKEDILCALARQNCVTMLETRELLDDATVAHFCEFISTLCEKVDNPACKEQSIICEKAAGAIKSGDKEKYFALCKQACTSCPYSQRSAIDKNPFIQ